MKEEHAKHKQSYEASKMRQQMINNIPTILKESASSFEKDDTSVKE